MIIPKTAEEMAAVIYLMEVNEWGLGVGEGTSVTLRDLAETALDAAETFFKAVDRRKNDPQEIKGTRIVREVRKKMSRMTDEERLAGVKQAMEIIKASHTEPPPQT